MVTLCESVAASIHLVTDELFGFAFHTLGYWIVVVFLFFVCVCVCVCVILFRSSVLRSNLVQDGFLPSPVFVVSP